MSLLLFFRWKTKDQRTQEELLIVSFSHQKLTRVKLSQREGNGRKVDSIEKKQMDQIWKRQESGIPWRHKQKQMVSSREN